jgi:quinolinate synthase
MDPELQGVLCACPWPHTFVSDSLAMADQALAMAARGAERIVVLGVDFMSENVRAVLDAGGLAAVPVLRVAREPIGCTLAAAAGSPAYDAWLDEAARTPRALHVVYINTGLDVKARAEARVPTLTCTSSNALRTLVQAIVQIPGVALRFGPDTHMGRNLRVSLERLAAAPAAEAARLHPGLTPAALAEALARYQAFPEGACVVHEVFGAEVARVVREGYPDALLAAHLEVPGELFDLALQARGEGRGVVGSTSDILAFILAHVDAALATGARVVAPVVLGTEAGMITSVVRAVQARLRAAARPDLALEILFPVAAEAVAATGERDLPVVPGVVGSEGCSAQGGCATCPYMKQNSLAALEDLLGLLRDGAGPEALRPYEPRRYAEVLDGRPLAEWGVRPILAMRHLQRTGTLGDDLVARVLG